MGKKAPLNRVAMLTSTTGQGTITVSVAVNNKLNTLLEAGAVDGDTYPFVLEEGNDFEIFWGTVGSSGTTVSRDEVIESKISGVAGTTKLTLAGGATVRSALPREALAQGWQLIESISATSGTNKVFDNIPDNYHDLMFIGERVRLASGNSALQLEPSINNGSSYIQTIDFSVGLSTTPKDFSLVILGAQLSFPTLIPAGIGTTTVNLGALIASRIDAIRISADQSGGVVAFGGSGVLKLYGR